MGTDRGLFAFNTEALPSGANRFRALQRRDRAPVGAVNAVAPSPEAPEHGAWVATDNGLLRFNPTTGSLDRIDTDLPGEPTRRSVRDVAEDEDRTVWAATGHGLYMRDRNGVRRRFTTRDGLPDDSVVAIALDGGDRLWIATPNGLGLASRRALRNDHRPAVRVFTTADGLDVNDVRSVAMSGNSLWVVTPNSVIEVRGAEPVGAGGLLVGQRLPLPTTRLADGTPWIPHASSMLGSGRASDAACPQPIVTELLIDGRQTPVPLTGSTAISGLAIPQQTSRVDIRFVRRPTADAKALASCTFAVVSLGDSVTEVLAAPSLGYPFDERTIPYYVHLSTPSAFPRGISLFVAANDRARAGRDRPIGVSAGQTISTQPIGDPQSRHRNRIGLLGSGAVYGGVTVVDPATVLQPGAYRIALGDTRIDFVVERPPWRQWWVLASAALPVALGVAIMVSRRRRRVTLRRARARIAADLHDSVGARLSRIAILSDVVRQQLHATAGDSTEALAAIGDNARSVIGEMNDAVWFIDPRCETIHHLLVRLRAVATSLFDPVTTSWSIDAPVASLAHPLENEQRRHLFLALKEALTNAARHAAPKRVTVHILISEHRIQATVSDDGIGFERPQRHERSGGNGLRNLRARATALGGVVTIGTSAGGSGTRVHLDIPVRAPVETRIQPTED